MKTFTARQINEAVAFSKAGGQALHLHRFVTAKAPACFKRDVRSGGNIAHLFDTNKSRLIRTCRLLGVRVIHIDREGTDKQHIDLCGKPLTNCWIKALVE